MVLKNSYVRCVDNTGAKLLKVIEVVGFPTTSLAATAGDEILVVVSHALPNKKARLGQKYRALVIQTTAPVGRPYGEVVQGHNVAILLRSTEDLPLGNRISRRYAVFREVRQKGWTKVAQLASKVV